MSCAFLLFALFVACHTFNNGLVVQVDGKEIEATSEWTLLGENDTVAAGMHVRMDMTTGEKWVKTIDEDESENPPGSASTTITSSGLAVTQVDVDANGNVEATDGNGNSKVIVEKKEPDYDYEMMHRALSNLPPEEQERIGGIPELPDQAVASKEITPEQRKAFEKQMKEIWEKRQEEIKAFQEDHLADLPQLLKDRISSIQEYLDDPIPQLQALDLEATDYEENSLVVDILSVLKDLEYQLTDVDMARDFHTLGGWPLITSLLADAVHENSSNATQQQTLTEEDWNKVNLIQAHAAWAIGTTVKNTAEFSPFATVQVDVPHKSADDEKALSVKTTALDLVLAQFVASSKAVLETTHPKDEYYDSVMMKVHKSLYALGALLRANRQAQTHFCADQGPPLLATILSVLADQAQKNDPPSLARDNLKVVQRLLSLAQDIVMDVTLHGSKSQQVDEAIRKAFSSTDWCNTVLRFVPIPRLYETTLLTVQQLAPHCRASWDGKEVQQQVQQPPANVLDAWLPKDLDLDLREERMNLLESTLQAIQTTGKKQ